MAAINRKPGEFEPASQPLSQPRPRFSVLMMIVLCGCNSRSAETRHDGKAVMLRLGEAGDIFKTLDHPIEAKQFYLDALASLRSFDDKLFKVLASTTTAG